MHFKCKERTHKERRGIANANDLTDSFMETSKLRFNWLKLLSIRTWEIASPGCQVVSRLLLAVKLWWVGFGTFKPKRVIVLSRAVLNFLLNVYWYLRFCKIKRRWNNTKQHLAWSETKFPSLELDFESTLSAHVLKSRKMTHARCQLYDLLVFAWASVLVPNTQAQRSMYGRAVNNFSPKA